MRLFKATYRDRRGGARKSAKWYIEFKDHLETTRRLAAFVDRRASGDLGRKLERLVAYRVTGEVPDPVMSKWLSGLPRSIRERLIKIGLIDPKRAAAGRSLLDHLDDFGAVLAAKGNTQDYVGTTVARLRHVIQACKFHFWPDISPSRVQRYLAELRHGPRDLGIRTTNYYVTAFKGFCLWMVHDRRASESPVAHLRRMNAQTDVRVKRRALSAKEVGRLLKAAQDGPSVLDMPGPERALLYRLAVETGLRWGELQSLTTENFDVDGNPPHVTVVAAYSKHRREDVLPLRRGTAVALKERLVSKHHGEQVLGRPTGRRGAELIRADLKAAEIEYIDAGGRRVDFHALRHTFLTLLAESGVHPKVAQALARHSDINLTMSVYTHTLLTTQADAVERLPDFTASDDEEVANTGTYGKSV